MTMRLDNTQPKTPTGPVTKKAGPEAAPEKPGATAVAPRRAGDTSKLSAATGEMAPTGKADIEDVDLGTTLVETLLGAEPQHAPTSVGEALKDGWDMVTAPFAAVDKVMTASEEHAEKAKAAEEAENKEKGKKPEKEEEPEAGAWAESLGAKGSVKGLSKLGSVMNAPQIAMHVAEGVGMIIENPAKALKTAKDMIEHPADHAQDAVNGYKAANKAVSTGKEVLEIGKEHAERVIENVREHGLTKGLKETAKDAGKDIQKMGQELGEALDFKSGGGLKNVVKETTKEAKTVANEASAKAMQRYLRREGLVQPKGLMEKAAAKADRVMEPLEKAGSKVQRVVGKAADRAANVGIKAMEKVPGGKAVLNGIERLHPAHVVGGKGVMKAAAAGKVAGHEAALATTRAALEKSGVKLSEGAARAMEHAGAEAATRTAAEVGAKAAGKALGRFAPGMNIAIAGMDAVHAYNVIRDPKASAWKKSMAGATAVFSAAAASNIPVVSQIGAAASIATSLLENVKYSTVKSVASKLWPF